MTALRAVPDTPPRAVLYLRQSTYREESISLELQETAGRDYCARQGYTVVGVEQDPGVSGRTWKRPAVQRVMQLIENRDAEVIVLWRWSRLSRSRKDWALAADRVDVAGGLIESATEPNDVTAAGRFARGVMTELAAFESERIGEQWREVHESRVKRGLPSGRLPWGWIHESKRAIPHPENSAVIPRLYEMYMAGMGGRQLADWLDANGYKSFYGGPWNHSTVTVILDSPFHSGQVTYHGELTKGDHEPLVSVEVWQQYRAMREVRAGERATRRNYLLSGLLTCGCGGTLYGFANNLSKRGGYFGYRCNAVSTNPEHGPGTVSTRIIDPAVMKWIADLGLAGDPEPDAVNEFAKLDAQRLAREITAIDSQVSALTLHLAAGIVPERAYRTTVDDLEARRTVLTSSLRGVESSITLTPALPAKDAQKLIDAWPTAPLAVKRATIRSLTSSITINFTEPRTLSIHPRGGTPVAIAL